MRQTTARVTTKLAGGDIGLNSIKNDIDKHIMSITAPNWKSSNRPPQTTKYRYSIVKFKKFIYQKY